MPGDFTLKSYFRRALKPLYWRLCPVPQEFSIAVVRTDSLTALHDAAMSSLPVLTRDQVTDVPAAFVADPFMWCHQGRWYMFFEVLNRVGWKGEIGLATSEDGLSWSYERIVLAESFHLSYPHVFEWAGDFYMVPEGAEGGGVTLYRAVDFPYRWQSIAQILRGDGIWDPTIFRYEGTWWIFAATRSKDGPPDLRLYFSSDLIGPWYEHPASPIVSQRYDIARPAGRVIMANGKPLRFAQGLKPAYGTNVCALRVDDLSLTRYAETQVEPCPLLQSGREAWNESGMHHLDAHQLSDGSLLACVDGWKQLSAKAGNLIDTMRYPRPKFA